MFFNIIPDSPVIENSFYVIDRRQLDAAVLSLFIQLFEEKAAAVIIKLFKDKLFKLRKFIQYSKRPVLALIFPDICSHIPAVGKHTLFTEKIDDMYNIGHWYSKPVSNIINT